MRPPRPQCTKGKNCVLYHGACVAVARVAFEWGRVLEYMNRTADAEHTTILFFTQFSHERYSGVAGGGGLAYEPQGPTKTVHTNSYILRWTNAYGGEFEAVETAREANTAYVQTNGEELDEHRVEVHLSYPT